MAKFLILYLSTTTAPFFPTDKGLYYHLGFNDMFLIAYDSDYF